MSDDVPMFPVRAAIFDFDGLMFNTEEIYLEVDAELLRRRGWQLTPDLCSQWLGLPSETALQAMIDSHKLCTTVEDLIDEIDELLPEILINRLAVMPGLMELLAELERRHLPTAVATSSRRAFVEPILQRFHLETRFQHILTREDTVEAKPHPEIYHKAAERLSLSPSEILVLEDSPRGCCAAVAAGALTVAVPRPQSHYQDFSGTILIADTLRDIRIYRLLDTD